MLNDKSVKNRRMGIRVICFNDTVFTVAFSEAYAYAPLSNVFQKSVIRAIKKARFMKLYGGDIFMRPSWDEYFMNMVEIVKTRSTCLRRQVGAIIVMDKRILASGYNGAPSGVRHCDEVGCLREQLNIPSGQRHELCRGVHAEQNAIAQAAMMGISVSGATMYITTQPCVICAKLIINAGIKRIVYKGDYPDALALNLMREAGIEVIRFENGRLSKVRLENFSDVSRIIDHADR